MKKQLTIFLLVSLLYHSPRLWGQAYRLEVTLKGIAGNTSCVLGHYNYSNQQFLAKDTARADANGRMVFEGKTPLPGGLYLVLLPGNSKWVELVYSGQETSFSVETDTASIIKSMKVKNSPENELFYAYQTTLRSTMDSIEAINVFKKRLEKDQNAQKDLSERMARFQKDFTDYRNDLFKKHPNSFTIKVLRASFDPEIPTPPANTDSLWTYRYYKSHYWDNFDFSDERLLRTPFIQAKVDRYLRDLVVQTPDSIIRDAELLINKPKINANLRKYLIFYITSQYESPKIVGTEAVFVHMAEKYYLGGQMELSEDGLRRIRERVTTMKPTLVTKMIPNASFTEFSKKPISIHEVKADYTVLYFYSPSCGHCKESAPKLREFYNSYKQKGVKVLAVAIDGQASDWEKFVNNYKLNDMLNGFDPQNRINYRAQFDVLTTPMVFILDKNKKILGRRIPTEELGAFMDFQFKKSPTN
jgi:thiol-disulfide isomerase/thioredoxin